MSQPDPVASARTRRELRSQRIEPAATQQRPRARRWPWLVGGALTLVLAAAVAAGIFATQAVAVRNDLTEAKDQLSSALDQVRAGDGDEANATVARVTALVAHADQTVTSPLWSVLAGIPSVGQNVAAVRDATAATNILVNDALPVGLELVGSIDVNNLTVEGGGFNLEPLVRAQAVLPEISDAFTRAQTAVSNVDRSQLLPVVDGAVGQLLDVIDQAAPSVELLNKYLPTLLEMAGSDGERNYLVIFQNNAESRATGGNASTSFLLTVDHGKITMGAQANAATYDAYGTSGSAYLELPAETLALYEDDFPRYSQNYTRTPNFPTSAELFSAIWQKTMGQTVDGVISIDPVVLSYMLRATGPVEIVDGQQLTSDNAVKVLLSDAYERFGSDGVAADRYFAAVAGGVFATVVGGAWDPLAMVEQLTLAASEQRVFLWFPRSEEEAMAADLGVSGAVATNNDEGLELGIFVNDAGYDKLSYYLSSDIQVSCDSTARTITTAITVKSSVPSSSLGGYTLSWRAPSLGIANTSMLLDILYLAPPQSTITVSDPATSDLDGWDRSGVEQGREGASRTIVLPMGETRTITYTSTIPDGATGPISVRHSAGVGQTPVSITNSCEGILVAR